MATIFETKNPSRMSEIDHHLEHNKAIKKAIHKKKISLFKKNLQQGMRQEEHNCSNFVAQLHSSIKKINEEKIALIIRLAEKMVNDQLELEPKLIASMASDLLKKISNHADIEILVSHKDAPALKSSAAMISPATATLRRIAIEEDSNLERGSILIRANKNIIDAQLKTQLQSSYEFLQGQIEGSNGKTDPA